MICFWNQKVAIRSDLKSVQTLHRIRFALRSRSNGNILSWPRAKRYLCPVVPCNRITEEMVLVKAVTCSTTSTHQLGRIWHTEDHKVRGPLSSWRTYPSAICSGTPSLENAATRQEPNLSLRELGVLRNYQQPTYRTAELMIDLRWRRRANLTTMVSGMVATSTFSIAIVSKFYRVGKVS